MAIHVSKSIHVEISNHDAESLHVVLIMAQRYLAEERHTKGCVPCVNEFVGNEVLNAEKLIEQLLEKINGGYDHGILS